MLSYDENFKKWQKSRERERERERESKTPGGVKIGIYRFIAVLLFCISTSDYAYGANCVLGQYLNEGMCSNCSQGSYCINNIQEACSGDNTLYSFSGSYAQNQCFKKLDGNTSGAILYDDLPKCENASGADVSGCLYYPNIGSNGCVVCPTGSGQIDLMNKCTDSTNASNYTNQSTDYHIEGAGNYAKCYSNTRNCNLFTTGNYVSGEAKWKLNNTNNNQTYEWDVVECIKQEEYNGNNCKGIQIEKPSIQCNAANDCHSWVQNATSSIIYNYYGYYCKSCNAGYEVNNSTDVNNQTTCSTSLCTDSSSANTCGSNQVYICKCGAIDRGYYRSTQVNLCDNNNCKRSFNAFLNLFTGNVNQPCGPGQTTNGGATSVNDCHYTERTRFCDAHGCFYLSNLSWDATNGYTWGGATSTSPGSD